MLLSRVFKYLKRLYIEKSNPNKKIGYLKKRGMKIGERCQINTMAFSDEPYLIELGNDVAIAIGTSFITHDGGIRCFSEFEEDDIFGRIIIGNNVFIGEGCIILLDTIIGDNCIVGAGSVVRGRFPDNSVIIGNPAKVITNMNVQRLLYRCNPGRIPTGFLSDKDKKPIVLKHLLTPNQH